VEDDNVVMFVVTMSDIFLCLVTIDILYYVCFVTSFNK